MGENDSQPGLQPLPHPLQPGDRIALRTTDLAAQSAVRAVFTIRAVQPFGRHQLYYNVQLEDLGEPGLPGLRMGQRYALFPQKHGVREAVRQQQRIRQAAGEKLGQCSFIAEVFGFCEAPGLQARLQESSNGRPWRLEIDDRLLARPKPAPCPEYREPDAFPGEYPAKIFFLARLHRLLTELGLPQLARRYRWPSWLGSTRVLLRRDRTDQPYEGLVAIDFEDPALPPDPPASDAPDLGLLSRDPPPDETPESSRTFLQELAYPFRLLLNRALRTQELLGLLKTGQDMLTPQETERLHRQIHDPFIQLYLQCMAVHLCMLPATNVIVIAGGLLYAYAHHLPLEQGIKIVLLGMAFFAVFPASPGSVLRGFFVLGVVLYRRQLRRFKVALILSFWRYVGYMAFPLQMVSTFPALARFLAARWATESVHLIPVIGQPGGRLEHRLFDLFFNLPLSLGRWWSQRRAGKN